MCIIVAKPAGAKMPDMKIIENCFTNNPDGAGFMFNDGNKVRGFKGFMNLEAFKAKLSKIEKKYGKLTMKNVVMHFRIGTHGSNIAANTHPFPLVSSYKSMRQLEWVNSIGVAHNGIIECVDRHVDIKKENVSDTMVFIKRVINPISSVTNIMKNDKILEGLWLASGSKLAFLDGMGTLKVLGDFTFDNGIYYSNTSYKTKRAYTYSYMPYGYSASDYDYGDRYGYSKYYTKEDDTQIVRLSKDEEKYWMTSIAQEDGLKILTPDEQIVFKGGSIEPVDDLPLALDPSTGDIMIWNDEDYLWEEYIYVDEIECIAPGGDVIE